jgi:hypothetical protein
MSAVFAALRSTLVRRRKELACKSGHLRLRHDPRVAEPVITHLRKPVALNPLVSNRSDRETVVRPALDLRKVHI